MTESSQWTEPERPAWRWPQSGYVHIPFCAHHCGYCDFAVVAGRDDQIDHYLKGLAAELAQLGTPRPVATLFLGGGTPTHLRATQLDRLLTNVTRWLAPVPGCEFSVEANPATLSDDRLTVLAACGVSRVSLGAQSFKPDVLRLLERDHGADDVRRAVASVRGKGSQASLDLIFGVPRQSLTDWEADLKTAVALEPDHISTYGLTYEKGTRLWKQRPRGELRALDEESERAQYELAMDLLEGAGFEQYEISSFARAGRRCRHNQVYWANEAYWGFGMGAARYIDGTRELNTHDLQTYLRRTLSGQEATFQRETLCPYDRAQETMSLQLRRREGIIRAAFCRQTGFRVEDLAGAAIARLTAAGFLEDDGGAVCLTRQGRCVADSVIRELW